MEEKVLEKLKEVIDPELGYNIVDLGQVEEIKIDEKEKRVYVKYLPTTPLCPYLPFIIDQIAEKIRNLGFEPDIDIDFENQWTPERMKKELRDKLGL